MTSKQDEDAVRWSELERCLAWVDVARDRNAAGGRSRLVESALRYIHNRIKSGEWPSEEED